MIEALGGFFGGLGLFFVGMWMLSESLKRLATRRLRGIAANWVPNRYAALGWGALAGGIIQSMSAMAFIAISLLRANLISTERAFAFILGGNLGVGILVLLVSLDVQLAALYILGVASVLMVSERAIKLRNVGTVMFGIALMYVGLGLVKESASSLSIQPLVDGFSELPGHSLLLSFFGAAVLSFAVQSSAAVAVFAISMGAIGVLTPDQVYVSIYGSFIGTSVTLLVLSWTLTGASRRVAMFQVSYNLLLILIFVPLLYVELWSGTPLMKSLVLAVPLDQPMAFLGLASDLFGVTFVILFLPLVARLFSRQWPATPVETMSQAEFIHNRSYENVAAALELIALEQRRVLTGFSSYLDAVRRGNGIDSLRNSVRTLIREVDEFLTEVRIRHPGYGIDEVNSALAQQRLITWLEEQFGELCKELNQLPRDETAGELRVVLVEGIDAVVLVIIDGLTSQDPEDWQTVVQLTGDRSELLRRIRDSYTSGDIPLSDAVQANILKVTNTAGEIFFLFSRLTQEMEGASIPSAAPPTLSPPPR